MMEPLVNTSNRSKPNEIGTKNRFGCRSLCVIAASIFIVIIGAVAYFGNNNLNNANPAKSLAAANNDDTPNAKTLDGSSWTVKALEDEDETVIFEEGEEDEGDEEETSISSIPEEDESLFDVLSR
eukprot:281899_1